MPVDLKFVLGIQHLDLFMEDQPSVIRPRLFTKGLLLWHISDRN